MYDMATASQQIPEGAGGMCLGCRSGVCKFVAPDYFPSQAGEVDVRGAVLLAEYGGRVRPEIRCTHTPESSTQQPLSVCVSYEPSDRDLHSLLGIASD